ncbi:MAG: DUF2164 domain-containing protein [Halioglobus sp.]
MATLEFTPEEKSQIVHKVKKYFEDELNQSIGTFEAEFMIDFFGEQVGAYFYNQGLSDAQAVVVQKVDEIGDSIYELERLTEFSK